MNKYNFVKELFQKWEDPQCEATNNDNKCSNKATFIIGDETREPTFFCTNCFLEYIRNRSHREGINIKVRAI